MLISRRSITLGLVVVVLSANRSAFASADLAGLLKPQYRPSRIEVQNAARSGEVASP